MSICMYVVDMFFIVSASRVSPLCFKKNVIGKILSWSATNGGAGAVSFKYQRYGSIRILKQEGTDLATYVSADGRTLARE